MRSQAGFTLIEGLAVGLIAAVLGGAILSLLYMNNAQIEENLARNRLALIYGVAAEHLHRVARHAYTVRGDFEALPLAALATDQAGIRRLVFYDKGMNSLGGFGVNAEGYLVDILPDLSEQVFRIGADSIHVIDPTCFTITADRRAIHFDLDISMAISGSTHELRSPREVVLCRNLDT